VIAVAQLHALSAAEAAAVGGARVEGAVDATNGMEIPGPAAVVGEPMAPPAVAVQARRKRMGVPLGIQTRHLQLLLRQHIYGAPPARLQRKG